MGRGRTTTGMCVAALVAAIEHGTADKPNDSEDEDDEDEYENADLNQDEAQYLKCLGSEEQPPLSFRAL